VLLAECGSHAVVGLELDRYDVSEVHGAYRLLSQVGPDMLVLVDAGLISGAFIEQVRQRGAHVLGALEAGAWERPKQARRLADGSVLAWVEPAHGGRYRPQRGMWVRIISYRVTDARLGEPGKVYRLVTTLLNPRVAPALTLLNLYHERWEIELVIDEIKTHARAQRKVLRSKTPEGVRQELSGTVALREAWKGYCAANPTYTIYVDEIYDQHERVIVVGHTSGSHLPASIEQKPSCVLWEARLCNEQIAAWIIYYPTTPEIRLRFHLL
jgi:DDE family transposase